MNVRRYNLPAKNGEMRELRIARAHGMLFAAIHTFERCSSGPFALDEVGLPTLRAALADVAAEIAAAADKEPAQ